MGARSLTDYFYTHNIGYSVSEEDTKKTENVIQYLLDCEISENEIMSLVLNEEYSNEYLTFEELPELLWQTSLLDKGVYYMHQELHLHQNANVVDVFSGEVIENNTSVEMKITYKWFDLLKYYCQKFDININMLNQAKEIGAFEFIYDLCKEKYHDLEPIDIILYLIDNASASSTKTISVLGLQEYLYETIDYMYSVKRELEYNNYNKIIWR